MAERERAKFFGGRRRRGRASSSQQREALGTEPSAQGRAGHLRLHPDASVFAGVQLAQFFVGRRLDEPEAGNDAPAQGAGHEDTQRRQEPTGENRDDSDQPDECQGEIEDGVVDADDEVFHGAYSLRDVEKIPLSGGRREHAITVPSWGERRECLSEKILPFIQAKRGELIV